MFFEEQFFMFIGWRNVNSSEFRGILIRWQLASTPPQIFGRTKTYCSDRAGIGRAQLLASPIECKRIYVCQLWRKWPAAVQSECNTIKWIPAKAFGLEKKVKGIDLFLCVLRVKKGCIKWK